MLTFIDSNNNNEVVKWPGQVRRKAFYIHGTISDPKRWDNWKEAVEVLNKIALPDAVDTAFDWSKEATQLNSLKERWPVSDRLVQYVKANALEDGFTEIVLIGHSHGGNVAIMTADKLAKESGILMVYVITVGTPVFNKKTFNSLRKISELKEIGKSTKIQLRMISMTAGAYQSYSYDEYTYSNPENPINWENGRKIKHLSIYNEYDRVDGVAQIFDPFIENSRMTSDTSTFEYNPNINKGVKSQLTTNEANRIKYCYYCFYWIAVLARLRKIINCVEAPFEEPFSQTPANRNQNNVRITKYIREFKVLGYRKISQLPAFKAMSLNAFLSKTFPPIDNRTVKSMTLDDMRFLFENDMQFIIFTNKFAEESKQKLQQKYPYPIKGGNINDFNFRSPNNKLIDEKIEQLTKEIARILDVNIRTDNDKFQNSHWALRWLVSNTSFPIRNILIYVAEGVDNHGFDTNSPELIQQEIDKGNIKPFPRVLKTETGTISNG